MPFDFSKTNDEKLVAMIQKGAHEAFSYLVKKHVTKFYYIAFSYLKSKEDAEDVVQDCFLKLWQNPHKFDHNQNVKFTTWFSRVISNAALDQLKKGSRNFTSQDFDIIDESKNQQQLAEEEAIKTDLGDALDHLKERQKQAILLSYYENRKNHESAKIMGLSLKAFQSLLLRSRENLKIIIQKKS